jgi:hypothetical protein
MLTRCVLPPRVGNDAMADDAQERDLPASARKLERARGDG